jgi:hypothetical protein
VRGVLRFVPNGTNSEIGANNLTEGRFRSYWERTEGSNERQRSVSLGKIFEFFSACFATRPLQRLILSWLVKASSMRTFGFSRQTVETECK